MFDSDTKMMFGGLAMLFVGLGLSLWGYINRDPVSGEYFIYPKLIIAGGAFTFFGFIYWRLVR